MYMCVVNSRIGLWGLWVGVCIEGSREYSVMGFYICMGFVPEGTNPILHSAGDLCHSAFIDPANFHNFHKKP